MRNRSFARMNTTHTLLAAAMLAASGWLAPAQSAHAQTPVLQWAHAYGGTSLDWALDVRQTSDGGFVMVGNTMSNDSDVTNLHGKIDCWVVRTNNAGMILWQKTFGGSGNDGGNVVVETSDGGVIICGVTASNDGDLAGIRDGSVRDSSDVWVFKLDAAGTILWQRTYGGSGIDAAASLEPTADGGYIVTGSSTSVDGDVGDAGDIAHARPTSRAGVKDVWLVKLDSAGALTWQKAYGGSSTDVGCSVQQTADGGYIVAAITASIDGDVHKHHGGAGINDLWALKVGATGTLEWQKPLGGSFLDGSDRVCVGIAPTGYYMSASTQSSDGDVTGHHGLGLINDFWVVHLDTAGTLLWQRALGSRSSDDVGALLVTADGGCVVGGAVSIATDDVLENHGRADIWMVKLDANGTMQWRKSLGGTWDENVNAIRATHDGGFVLAGSTYSNDGDVTGHHGTTGSNDAWVVKMSAEPAAVTADAMRDEELVLAPNPTSGRLSVSLPADAAEFTVFTMMGQTVMQGRLDRAPNTVLDVSALPAAMYIARITDRHGRTYASTFIRK